MCGRFTLRKPRTAFDVLHLPDPGEAEIPDRFNIAPSQKTAIVRREASGLRSAFLPWGWPAPWKKETGGELLINARAETAPEKPLFRQAYAEDRCLVPADGFYEWRREGRKRSPFFFSLSGGQPFALAGLLRENRFCILTTVPNELMSPIHDRMPVLLTGEGLVAWLAEAPPPRDLFAPFPASQMECRPVSPLVNDVRQEGPACLGGGQLELFS